jgi:hypothetical protein
MPRLRPDVVVLAVVVLAVELGVASPASATPKTQLSQQLPTIPTIERDLADALARAKTTRVLRFLRHRTNTPGAPVKQIEWANLANGQRREFDHSASGRLTTRSWGPFPDKFPNGKWNPSGACGCDLDPFINFPGRALHVSLLADQTIDGQSTFHLRFTVSGGMQPSTTDFWIDRSTHLPVHSKIVYREVRSNGQLGPTGSTTDKFTWLPRTSANLAHLAGG